MRRRMLQKLTFLTEDLAVSDTPAREVLEQYHSDNSENYRQPERYSFQHRYFSTDRRDNAEQLAAQQALTDQGLISDLYVAKTIRTALRKRDWRSIWQRIRSRASSTCTQPSMKRTAALGLWLARCTAEQCHKQSHHSI